MKNLEKLLCCPQCKKNLSYKDNSAYCKTCNKDFKKKGNKYYFINDNDNYIKNNYKYLVKQKFPFIEKYINFIGPMTYFNFFKYVKSNINLDNKIMLNVGSGNTKFNKYCINVDFFNFTNVNIICNAESLPFKNNTFDITLSKHMLEHAKNPNKIIHELFRVTKKNGYTVHEVPFAYPVHDSPSDFFRFTPNGLKSMLEAEGWKPLKITPTAGFFSILSLLLTEFFTSIPYTGQYFKLITRYVIGTVIFPIKIIDFLSLKLFKKFNLRYSASFVTIAKK